VKELWVNVSVNYTLAISYQDALHFTKTLGTKTGVAQGFAFIVTTVITFITKPCVLFFT
jgi:hypothetical protein